MSDSKYVIVAGQEFSVPAATDNEAIRETLKTNFPDVATAEIKIGKRTVGDQEVETVEFVKRAGTKGLTGTDLAQLLRTVPTAALPTQPRPPRLTARVKALVSGTLTFAAALDDVDGLIADLELSQAQERRTSNEGNMLCRTIDELPAVAAPRAPLGW